MSNPIRRLAERMSHTPPSATVRIADLASKMRREGIRVLDFSAGRAAEPSPEYVNRAASEAVLTGDTHQTPAQGKHAYRVQVADKLRRENDLIVDPDENVMATLGCKNGLTLALMATVNPGDEVIVEDPCFVSYGATIGFLGAKAVPVPLREENHFRWTAEDLNAAITPRTRCILICSPQNPTGVVHTPRDLDIIAEAATRHNLWVISDEIYERVTWGGRRHVCLASRPGMKERAIGLMGFTKTLSMGGWRIGYMYAPQPIVEACVIVQQHLMTCAGSFTQSGAAVALQREYSPEVSAMWRDWERRCDFVCDAINRVPKLSCARPEGGFYAWIDIRGTKETPVALCERLLREQRVALVPGTPFGRTGEGYVRMTCVKSWDDLREGLDRISAGVQ